MLSLKGHNRDIDVLKYWQSNSGHVIDWSRTKIDSTGLKIVQSYFIGVRHVIKIIQQEKNLL